MNILLSPHVDDEIIGCFRLIQEGLINKVVYFYDLTIDRQKEAIASGNHWGYQVSFSGYGLEIPEDVVLYVPNIADTHIHHKNVNRYAKTLPNKKYYYSVDMNVNFNVLGVADQQRKRVALEVFTSQAKLLEDEKYYLFDSIVEDDSSKMIWVTFQRKGLHFYPAAAADPKLADVGYLGTLHRHLFKFKVYIEVFHNDRDLEFHQFLNWLESLYDDNIMNCDRKSCEMLADDLYIQILKKYPGRQVKIEVSEDGENGVTVDYK